MPRRNSYLNQDVLQEIAGRLKFGGQPLEDVLPQIDKPEPKPWTYPTHPLDDVAAEFGMHGFEFKHLQEAALREMPKHTLLQFYYKRFLMAAKLVLDDELEKIRQHERRQSEEKNKRDSIYISKLRSWEARNAKLTKSWTDVRATIRTRWEKLGRSMVTLLEANSLMGTMDRRDQMFLDLLGGRGIVETDLNPDIDQRRVLKFDWEEYVSQSIEDINEIIMDLEHSSAGGFVRKPTVTKLGEPA